MASNDDVRAVPRPGFVVGAAAFLGGYLIVYLSQAARIRDAMGVLNTLVSLVGGEAVPTWKVVGWVFYSAHFVDLTFPALGGGRVARNLIESGAAPGALYLVPAVLLVVAGGFLAWYVDATDPFPAAIAGGSVAAGYTPLAIVGLFVVRVSMGDATVSPDLVTGVLLAGVVYPQFLGGLGGAVVAVAR